MSHLVHHMMSRMMCHVMIHMMSNLMSHKMIHVMSHVMSHMIELHDESATHGVIVHVIFPTWVRSSHTCTFLR